MCCGGGGGSYGTSCRHFTWSKHIERVLRTHADFKQVKSIFTKPIPPNLNMESSFGALGYIRHGTTIQIKNTFLETLRVPYFIIFLNFVDGANKNKL